MELTLHFDTIESARNASIRWLEQRGAVFDGRRRIVVGKFGELTGKETGVESAEPFWRLRLDYDPRKGTHFNAEYGKVGSRQKAAFLFPGGSALIARLARSRDPR